LQDNWYCISVKNATAVFSSLYNILLGTIILVIATTIIIGLIMVNSNNRSLIAEKAVAASEAKSSFLSRMSHEIRTPINAIIGMDEMILRECDDRQILSYANNIKKAGSTLLGLINDILDFSKIEAGKVEIIRVDYDLSSLLNDLVNMVKPRAEEKNLTFRIDFDPRIPKYLHGDEIRIKQIISNILTNAVKYTENGHVIFSVTCEDDPFNENRVTLAVSVKDTGIGIKEDDINKLFDEFERIEEDRNRSIEGTGLGMNITIRLLKLMDSNLEVQSTYGEGSEFSFKLTQDIVKNIPLGYFHTSFNDAPGIKPDTKEILSAPSAKILVVDDNPMNLTVFQSLLKRTLISIDTAESGNDAVLRTNETKYDLIFMDHMMPVKDGIETLHEIRLQEGNPNQNTPTVCLTANAISGAREQYIANGFTDYLTKPINTDKLESMLIHYLPPDKVKIVQGEDDDPTSQSIPRSLEVLNEDTRFDIYAGIKNCGSVEEYLSLLKIFLNSLSTTAETLDNLYLSKDIQNYTVKIHALKSSARIIGVNSLSEYAGQLEKAGKENDYDYITANHRSFITDYLDLKDALTGIFDENESATDSGKPSVDEGFLNAAYKKLLNAAEEMNIDEMDEIFREISNFRLPDPEKKLWEQVVNASNMFDYKAVVSLIKENKNI
ncbi:MAG: response regulator, partial [Lachnospiraceae bacterium]|nr:response regulator [Lachnospiraceae bacterium]